MATSHPIPDEFKQICLREFAFLSEQFDFTPEELPLGETINPVQVRFVNPTTRVCIEGRAWGESILVSLASLSGRWARLVDILSIRSPDSAAPFGQRGDQRVLLSLAAAAMRLHASDILSGDFSIFEAAEIHRRLLHESL